MAIDKETFLAAYEAGGPVTIPSGADLVLAENIIREEYLPAPDHIKTSALLDGERDWQAKERLIDAIRGKFIGNLVDVSIAQLDDPYATLQPLGKHDARLSEENVHGFIISAIASSTQARNAGTIERPVWIIRASMSAMPISWRRVVGREQGDNSLKELRDKASRSTSTLSTSRQVKSTVHSHRR